MKEVLVIKIGGSTLEEEDTTLKNIAVLHQQGNPMIIIHGGGKEIDQALNKNGRQPKKIDGKRVTDWETLEVVIDTLLKINHRLVEKFESLGMEAFPVGPYPSVLEAEKESKDLGFVGRAIRVKQKTLSDLLKQNNLPVISPIAANLYPPYTLLNVNADQVAASVSLSFPDSSLILLTDVLGVTNGEGILMDQVSFHEYQQLKAKNVIEGGMIPKLDAAFSVAASGKRALICHYTNLPTALSAHFIGTEVSYAFFK